MSITEISLAAIVTVAREDGEPMDINDGLLDIEVTGWGIDENGPYFDTDHAAEGEAAALGFDGASSPFWIKGLFALSGTDAVKSGDFQLRNPDGRLFSHVAAPQAPERPYDRRADGRLFEHAPIHRKREAR